MLEDSIFGAGRDAVIQYLHLNVSSISFVNLYHKALAKAPCFVHVHIRKFIHICSLK